MTSSSNKPFGADPKRTELHELFCMRPFVYDNRRRRLQGHMDSGRKEKKRRKWRGQWAVSLQPKGLWQKGCLQKNERADHSTAGMLSSGGTAGKTSRGRNVLGQQRRTDLELFENICDPRGVLVDGRTKLK